MGVLCCPVCHQDHIYEYSLVSLPLVHGDEDMYMALNSETVGVGGVFGGESAAPAAMLECRLCGSVIFFSPGASQLNGMRLLPLEEREASAAVRRGLLERRMACNTAAEHSALDADIAKMLREKIDEVRKALGTGDASALRKADTAMGSLADVTNLRLLVAELKANLDAHTKELDRLDKTRATVNKHSGLWLVAVGVFAIVFGKMIMDFLK